MVVVVLPAPAEAARDFAATVFVPFFCCEADFVLFLAAGFVAFLLCGMSVTLSLFRSWRKLRTQFPAISPFIPSGFFQTRLSAVRRVFARESRGYAQSAAARAGSMSCSGAPDIRVRVRLIFTIDFARFWGSSGPQMPARMRSQRYCKSSFETSPKSIRSLFS